MNELIIETATVALATFFATIGPLDVAAVYADLTATESPQRTAREPLMNGIQPRSIF